jgi:hypothetical protein
MCGSELMTTIILASVALFALTGVFLGRIGTVKQLDAKSRIKQLLNSGFYIGAFAIICSVGWFLFSYAGWSIAGTSVLYYVAAVAFIIQVASSFWILYRLLEHGSDKGA